MYPWSLAQRSFFSMSENQTLLRNTKNPIKSWMTVQPVGPSTHISKFKPQWYYYLPANFCDVQRNKRDRNLVRPPECTRSHDRCEEAAGSLSPALPHSAGRRFYFSHPVYQRSNRCSCRDFQNQYLAKCVRYKPGTHVPAQVRPYSSLLVFDSYYWEIPERPEQVPGALLPMVEKIQLTV